MGTDDATTYVRFVLLELNPDSGAKEGLFKTAYDLRREGELSADEFDELDELLRWLGDNLDVPTRFNKTKSKGFSQRNTKGISWFKPTAGQHITKMYQLAAILGQHGHTVNMLRTSNPGYVVYEDDYQLVAEPFSDLRG